MEAEMTRNLPLLPLSAPAEICRTDDELALSNKLERCLELHQDEPPPTLWTGTRGGVIGTVIAITASLLFGGAAGAWFDHADWLVRFATMGIGTMLMASLVCASGTWLTGRNAIFWGIGMPLLVYFAGTFCALAAGSAGATSFLLGAPAFCGLAILAGVMTAYGFEKHSE
jgi:hypothetical protein